MSPVTTIIIREFGGSRRVRLDAAQRKLFQAELRRVRKYFPSSRGVPYRIAPDCTITITQGSKKSHYELYSRAVLFETRSKKKWQFYCGLLLLEWLYP